MTKLHVIENESWQVGILPEAGASIAFARIKFGGQWRDFMRPTPEANYGNPSDCASFVLVPWSNRIRDARFRFEGAEYQLTPTGSEGMASHGVGRNYPWRDEALEPQRAWLQFNTGDYSGLNFPFRFSTWIEYRLEGANFVISTTLRNEDSRNMPGAFGHHPYYQREFDGPGDSVQLEIPCTEYFELTNYLATAAPVPIVPRLDFRQLRSLGSDEINDCLTGREGNRPIRFVYSRSGQQIALHADAILACVVLFTPAGKPFFAVEPVTNANDGFNLREQGIPGSGVFVLQPNEQRGGDIRFEVQ
jgi:aldose 1-epimerase